MSEVYFEWKAFYKLAADEFEVEVYFEWKAFYKLAADEFEVD